MSEQHGRHQRSEELISASLSGDLSQAEHAELAAHLRSCATCRATMTAFSEQRRMVAGLRHLAPPRDLHARVRTGIAAASVPWWRRPAAIIAGVTGASAMVAGALLGLVVLNDDRPNVGQVSPTPSAISSASLEPTDAPIPTAQPSGPALPTLPPPETPAPTPGPGETAQPTPAPTPTGPASTASPEPDVFVAVTGEFDNPAMTVRDGTDSETIAEAATPAGEPIAAALSPDGQWLVYITVNGASGFNEVSATRIAVAEPSDDPDASPPVESSIELDETVDLGASVAGSPFLEQLFWSPDSRYLAYTLADVEGRGTDVWIFEPGVGEPQRLTETGTAYAGSWVANGAGSSLLWVSTAADTPRSDLVVFDDNAGPITPIDPAESDIPHAENVFQPLLSPNGAFVIFWSGRMSDAGEEWLFSEGGAPWLAQNTADGQGGFEFTSAREVFRDVTVRRDGFRSAAISWGPDSNAFAVWQTEWTGTSQSSEEEYPDPARVYFTHATDPRGLTQVHAIDPADIPEDAFVVDVEVSPTGRHLVITAGHPRGGIGDPLRADLILVTRNTGDVADDVEFLGRAEDGWFGPAAYLPVSEEDRE